MVGYFVLILKFELIGENEDQSANPSGDTSLSVLLRRKLGELKKTKDKENGGLVIRLVCIQPMISHYHCNRTNTEEKLCRTKLKKNSSNTTNTKFPQYFS